MRTPLTCRGSASEPSWSRAHVQPGGDRTGDAAVRLGPLILRSDDESAGGKRRIVADDGVQSIEGPFLAVARRYSLCDDDAWDALGRGFEIAVRHRDRIRPDTAGAWFATVVRHEAMRIRRGRYRDASVDAAVREPSADEPEPEREPDPRLPALRAAMRRLKPDERRALILFYAMEPGRGERARYRRIMQATGWSYTKVNRCLSEGRASLRALLLGDSAEGAGIAAITAHRPRRAGSSPVAGVR